MRRLILFLLRRPVFATMMLLVPAAGSIMIARSVPLALAPPVVGQTLSVSVTWPDASPESLETQIVSGIEQEAATLRGVESVSSVSRRGSGTVTLEFAAEADIDAVRFALQDRLRSIELPEGSRLRVNDSPGFGSSMFYSDDPIERMLSRLVGTGVTPFLLRLSSDDSDWLQGVANREVRNTFLALPDVAEVSVSGGRTDVVEIVFRPADLLRLSLSPSDLAEALRSLTTERTEVGLHTEFGAQLPIVVQSGRASADAIGQITMVTPRGVQVGLHEIADITRRYRPPEDRSRVDGAPALLVEIGRKSESNLIDFSRSVREAVSLLETRFDGRVSIEVLSDEGAEVERLLSDLVWRLVGSIAAVILALLVFFRQLRPSLLVFVGLALTLLITVAILALADVALSMITVAALVLASGMLVDNSLVIYEHLQGSRTATEVADRSASVLPVIGSASLTNIVVFVPFLFLSGTLRALLIPFAVTMLAAVGSSILVSIVAVPFAFYHLSVAPAARARTPDQQLKPRSHPTKPITRARITILPLLRLRRVLLPVVLAITVYAFVVLLPDLWGRRTYQSPGSYDSVTIGISMLSDARVEETDKIAGEFEVLALNTLQETGATSELQIVADVHRARANIRVLPRRSGPSELSERATNALLLIEQRWMLQMGNYVSVSLFLNGPSGRSSGGGGGESFASFGGNRIEVTGYDYELLKEHVIAFSRHMERVPYLYGLDNGFEREERTLFGPSFPGFDLYLDQSKMTAAAVDRSEIARAIEAFDTQGTTLSVRLDDAISPVTVEIAPEEDTRFFRIRELLEMPLTPGFRLGDVAEIHPLNSAMAITRENQRYVHTIRYESRPMQHADVRAALAGLMEYYPLPAGFVISFAERYSEQQEASQRNALGIAALAGALLVYMVLAGHLESFTRPLLIFLAIPLALVAVLVGYSFLETGPDIGGLLGMILLAGITVNDAILFTAETVRLERRSKHRDTGRAPAPTTKGVRRVISHLLRAPIGPGERVAALAIRHRLRPILVTTFTTIVALAPSLFVRVEQNDLLAMWREFAFVVAIGLLASTIATVAVVPLLHAAGRRVSIATARRPY
ncbi:MAG: efflux RND transporter permease subunit [Spirochaetales bacterium]